MKILLLFALAICTCCNQPPSIVPVTTDASDAAPLPAAQMACAHLKQLGCPLGSDPNCTKAFSLPSKFKADPSCVLGVDAAAGLAACNVTCQP